MPIRKKEEEQETHGAQDNPLGDPRAFRGYRTNLQKLAESTKKSEFLPSFSRSFGGFVIEVAKIIIIALLIIKPIHAFLLQPFYVKGASMEPTFRNNEYLIVDQLSYRLHDPRRGDVVVIRNPFQPDEFFIKRIIGLPADRLLIADGRITVFDAVHPDGQALDESAYLSSGSFTPGHTEVTLGVEEYYVLGDNRTASLDSRTFGPIERRAIVGRTAVRAWPIYRAQTFQTPTYPLPSPAAT
ncbi:MAG: signal peptidase I [Candidatus Kerfeldbacteria bacterium]|nr:signal peptidase I [Candidatus Kerfeldbacteria bacterium]